MALDFDGSNDFVSYGNRTEFDGAAAVTWSFWMWCDVDEANRLMMLRQASPGVGWAISATSLNRFQCNFGAGGGQNIGTTPVNAISIGRWQHWFWVYDGTGVGNAGRLKCWLDGGAQTLAFSNTIPATIEPTSTANLLVGNTASPFDGKLAHIKIWMAALPTLVTQEMLSYRPTRTANLLVWSPYDDGVAGRNYAGNGFHGTVSGPLAVPGPAVEFGAAA